MQRLRLLFFSLADAAWLALRGAGKAVLGEERLDRLMARTGLRELKNTLWRAKAAMPDGNVLVHRPNDKCIIEEIYAKAYDRDADILPGQTVVDVGGHIGVFALYAARKVGAGGKVVVCEPGPDNLALLRENLELNASPQVALYPFAVADREGEADLFIPEGGADNPAANTLFETRGRRRVRVTLKTLDQIVAAEKLETIDHLKIDVEGAELLVLGGARSSLALARRIVMEIHPGKVDPAQVLARLGEAGFRVKTLSGKPLIVEALR